MKKLIVLFIALTSISYSQTKKEILVGTWKATDANGVENKMIFSADNFVSMTVNGEFIDGRNYIVKGGKNNGEKGFLKYEIDDSKTPIQMDIIASMTEKGKLKEKGRILAILDLKNENEIKINISLTGKRAVDFNDATDESTILLQREK